MEVEVFDENMDMVSSFSRSNEHASAISVVEPLPEGTYYYRLRAGEKVSDLRKIRIN